MYEKFSKRVEQVVRMANRIAHEYDAEWVGTEHLLLAIAREGTGIGAKVLKNHNLDDVKLKAAIDQFVKKSLEDTWVFGRLPGTPHFRNVVATAIEEARGLSSAEVCTEHLLLALLHEKGSIAHSVLTENGVQLVALRAEIASMESGRSGGS